MPTQTVVLITGANRGIGKGFASFYLQRPHHTVIAANRNPDHPTSLALHQLPKSPSSTLIIVELDATVPSDPGAAAKLLSSPPYNISALDILIANAGISQSWPKVSEVQVEDLQRHMVPNVHGVIWLYQAFLPMLRRAENPKWVAIGSSAGMLTEMATRPMPNAAYGPTKVVLHWLTAKMHFEEEKLVALPMDPG